MKHEYEVLITYTETHSVFVIAEDEDQAKEMALDKFYDGGAEMRHWNCETEINWSDEES